MYIVIYLYIYLYTSGSHLMNAPPGNICLRKCQQEPQPTTLTLKYFTSLCLIPKSFSKPIVTQSAKKSSLAILPNNSRIKQIGNVCLMEKW